MLSAATSEDATEGRQFLSILFDRQDFLFATSGYEDGDSYDAEVDKTLDPRLLFEDVQKHKGSSMASRLPTPGKENAGKSIYVTHLRSRQPIISTIRIHTNLNVPFSSGAQATNYPKDVPDTQVNKGFLPTWALMVVSTRPDPGSVQFAFSTIHQDAMNLLDSGTPVDSVIEAHPNIAALFDESEFRTSGLLSRWAAGMVHSVMLKGTYDKPNCFGCVASKACLIRK